MPAAAVALAATPSAYAHELGLVLVGPPAANASSSDAVDGFRLAVAESPDVSHPAGQEAGDHLGGIDVETTLVTGRSDSAARRAARAVGAGARIVVVLPPGAATARIVSGVRAARPLIVLAGTRGALPAKPDTPAVVLRRRPTGPGERDRLARFERRFANRYGREPSAAARTGYNAGRLLDSLLAQLGEGSFAGPGLAAAVARAEGDLLAVTASLVRTAPVRTPSATSDDRGSTRGEARVLLLGAGAAAVAVAALLLLRSRRRRALG